MNEINIPTPHLQIDFSYALGQIRNLYLQDALLKAIEYIDIKQLDQELSNIAPTESLKTLAKHGMRGELVFPSPCILKQNPFLLGYYRLLLGFSQKEFYTTKFGVSKFKSMETKGILTLKNEKQLNALCKKMSHCCAELISGIGIDRLSKNLLDDLTLLTVGPQLRGGANVKKGVLGIVDVFQIIHEIVEHATTNSSTTAIEIKNAANRKVYVEFAPDPDIVIREEMSKKSYRNIIAIEVKAGTDFSNIHNRMGEAEKSHQKAKSSGYVECWTVVNVDNIDINIAKKESPSTNSFYKISDLKSKNSSHYKDFKERIISLTGIKAK